MSGLTKATVGWGHRRADAQAKAEFFAQLRRRGLIVPQKNQEFWLQQALSSAASDMLGIQTAPQLVARFDALDMAAGRALSLEGLTEVQSRALHGFRRAIPELGGFWRFAAPERWLRENLITYLALRQGFETMAQSLNLAQLGFDASAVLAAAEIDSDRLNPGMNFLRVFRPTDSATAAFIRGQEAALEFPRLGALAQTLAAQNTTIAITLSDLKIIVRPDPRYGITVGVAEIRVTLKGAVGDQSFDESHRMQFNVHDAIAGQSEGGDTIAKPLSGLLEERAKAWLAPLGYRMAACAGELSDKAESAEEGPSRLETPKLRR